jgi:hypothetical protein
VLSFSDLILYEAVLTYVGVGVDPSMNSFGGMINLARSEMSRDPVVWWSFAAAFGFMVALVLAANLFADGVRDAFDPRARSFRPRFKRSSPEAPDHAEAIDNLKVALDADAALVRAIDGLRLASARRDLCAGGRVRLRQEHDGAGADAAAARERPRHRRAHAAGRGTMLDLPESQHARVRGGRIGMIFQEPSTSLNPVMRVGDQIVEAIETPHRPARRRGARQGHRVAAPQGRHPRARAPHRRLPVPHERRPEAARDDRDDAGLPSPTS